MKTITQRDLRNRSGQLLREAERGEQILITVEGHPVALLGPCARRQWVPRAEVVRLIGSIPADPSFFDDIAELGGTIAGGNQLSCSSGPA
jgi:prevent-host-death family protein